MHAQEIASQCVRESGALGYDQSNELALLGLALVPDGDIDKRTLRREMKSKYLAANGEYGFVFTVIILPMLISIISNWIVKWIWDRRNRSEIRAEATLRLYELSPRWTATLTSISSPPTKHTEQPG